jgi:low affinity Fe/Cu permease
MIPLDQITYWISGFVRLFINICQYFAILIIIWSIYKRLAKATNTPEMIKEISQSFVIFLVTFAVKKLIFDL